MAHGVQASGFPAFTTDSFSIQHGKTWVQMTNAERAASATNTGHLTWNGSQVIGDVPTCWGLRVCGSIFLLQSPVTIKLARLNLGRLFLRPA